MEKYSKNNEVLMNINFKILDEKYVNALSIDKIKLEISENQIVKYKESFFTKLLKKIKSFLIK